MVNQHVSEKPPRLAQKILQWYCNEDLFEEISGDLEEQHKEFVQNRGKRAADINYWKNVLLFIKPFTMKRDFYANSNFFTMVKNYIIVALRSLRKKPGYTFVNILGLSIGLACCILIALFVSHELSYDDFQDDDVYRIALNRKYPDREVNYTVIPHSIGPQLVTDFSYVESEGRYVPPFGPTTVRYEDKYFDEDQFGFGDSTLFEVLKFNFTQGDPKTALVDKNSVVISETTAKKYFGEENPLGKTLRTDIQNFNVTGVFKDYPEKSHFQADLVGALHSFPFMENPGWAVFSSITYVKLKDNTDPSILEEAIPPFIKKYAESQIQQMTGQSYDAYVAAGNGYIYSLQPIKDIHLHSNLEGELKANGSIQYVYIFISVAAFILLIACINFVNLATARSSERAKEVGIRKVLGSLRKQLIGQFLAESIVLSVFSLVVSLLFVRLALPYFNEIANRSIDLTVLVQPIYIAGIIAIIFFIGILAGLYPAFILSSFRPAQVLKGKMHSSKPGVVLRNSLVVFQFAISITLISSTMIIFDQMNFMVDKELGYNKENIVVVEGTFSLQEKDEVFKQSLSQFSEINSTAYVSTLPGSLFAGFNVRVAGGEKDTFVGRTVIADEDYIKTMKMEMVEGRSFDESFNDSMSLILNETAVKKLNLMDPIGTKLINTNNGNPPQDVVYTIVGVVKDFHFQPLHRDIEPLFINSMTGPLGGHNYLLARISGENYVETMANIEEKWIEMGVESPFKASFMDQNLEAFYQTEKTSGRLFTAFTTLAILIACIGLFGLAAFTTNQKTKEIGVRKVMGASIPSIVVLISMEFTKLILIAIAIAIPFTWYSMNRWLQDFAYRIDINVLTFIISGLVAILIGWITVSYQSIRAASVNPVKSLRTE